jgi:hypothetical protein
MIGAALAFAEPKVNKAAAARTDADFLTLMFANTGFIM